MKKGQHLSIQQILDRIKQKDFLLNENISYSVIDDLINTIYSYLMNNRDSLDEEDIFTLFYALNTLYTKKGDMEGLLQINKQWEAGYPQDPYPKLELGELYFWHLNNINLALDKFNESIKLSNKNDYSYERALYVKALILFELGEYDDCYETLIKSSYSYKKLGLVKKLVDKNIHVKELQSYLQKMKEGISDKKRLLEIEQIVNQCDAQSKQ
jgi:tetratricopeptide (TPR) repeat protein